MDTKCGAWESQFGRVSPKFRAISADSAPKKVFKRCERNQLANFISHRTTEFEFWAPSLIDRRGTERSGMTTKATK